MKKEKRSKMTDNTTLFIYLGCFVIGFLVGSVVNYKKYRKLILEVLDNLKFTDIIDGNQYEYYKEKFIKEKDSLKGIKELSVKLRSRKGKEDKEI